MAINGYGVIGRRVADAVALQEDMEVVGIADVVGDYRLRRAQSRGFAVYSAIAEQQSEMQDAGIDVGGTLNDLLERADEWGRLQVCFYPEQNRHRHDRSANRR